MVLRLRERGARSSSRSLVQQRCRLRAKGEASLTQYPDVVSMNDLTSIEKVADGVAAPRR